MKTAVKPILFVGSQFGETHYVCAFFNSNHEADRGLLPFIKDRFACGDKAISVVNPVRHRPHLQKLLKAGIGPTASQQKGQFELPTNTDTYLQDGL